jgi:hypothetical protein
MNITDKKRNHKGHEETQRQVKQISPNDAGLLEKDGVRKASSEKS